MAASSVASSTGSNHGTVSPEDTFNIDFNPERDEAICSTIQFKRDFSKTLPELRDTAKKYGRWAPRPQQDIVINTSALARAFPDFSQAGSPNDTFSLEIPRGHREHQNTPSRLEFSSDMNPPTVNLPNNLRILHTPKRSQAHQPTIFEDGTRNNTHSRKTENPLPTRFATEHKENIPPIPQQSKQSTKRSPYTSNASRVISGERRSLKELHARVADESDGSVIGERPASVTFQPRNTRFSKVAQSSKISNTEQAAKPEPVQNSTAQKKQTQQNFLTSTVNQSAKPSNITQQSFLVGSTFNSAQNTQTNALPVVHHGKVINGGKPQSFGPVDGINLPDEEEDIYELARKLKSQVAQLEIDLAAAHNTINELQRDNQMATEKRFEQGRRISKENEDLFEENQALRKQLAQIQGEQDNGTQTWQRQELALKSQVDQILSEKEENTRTFQNQQSALRNQVDQLRLEKEESIRRFQNQQSALRSQVEQLLLEKEQNTRTWQQKETALQSRIQRRDELVKSLTIISQQLMESTQNMDFVTSTHASKSTSARSTREKKKMGSRSHEQDLPSKVMKQAQNHVEDIKAASINVNSHRHPQSSDHNQNRKQEFQETRAGSPTLDFNLREQVFGHSPPQIQSKSITAPREQNDETQITQEESFDDNTGDLQNDTQNINQNNDDCDELSDVSTNYSSVVGHGVMPELRQFLKTVKKSEKSKLDAAEQASVREGTIQSGRSSRAQSVKMNAEQPTIREDTIQTIQSGRSSHAPSAKRPGILKTPSVPTREDLTGRFSIKSATSNGGTQQDQTTGSNTHRRHHSQVEEDCTIRTNTSHRRHHSETSVHTTTRHQIDGDDMTSAYLITDINAAKQGKGIEHPVLSASARQVLDSLCKHNCKNCHICLRLASFNTNDTGKKAIRIQKPIPVSKRAPSLVPYDDEPTLRPAVAPGVALATVLKSLEDEVAHLKLRQSQVQEAYVKHDASLGKREREGMKLELESLLRKIESKSDQIYALYDVLEGQAQAGQEMVQKELDITLKEIESDELDIEEDLPWEGIEESVY